MGNRRRPVHSELECKFPRPLQFRFGWGSVSAIATQPADRSHLHVIHLLLDRSRLTRSIIGFVHRMPLFIQSAVGSIWPGLFLPSQLILKKLKKDWDEEFDNERQIYERLKPLQGCAIPRLYGEVRCEGTRALILEKVDGVLPFKQTRPYLEREELRQQVTEVLRKLQDFGLAYEDPKLSNLLLLKDRAVLLDLEMAWEPEPADQEFILKTRVNMFLREYDEFLKGELEAD